MHQSNHTAFTAPPSLCVLSLHTSRVCQRWKVMSHRHIRKIETSEQSSHKLWLKQKPDLFFKKNWSVSVVGKVFFQRSLRFTNICRQDLSQNSHADPWHCAFSTIAIRVGKWVRQFATLTPPSPSIPYYHFRFGLRTYKSVGVFMSNFFEQSQMKGKCNSDCGRLKRRKSFRIVSLSGWDHLSASVGKNDLG